MRGGGVLQNLGHAAGAKFSENADGTNDAFLQGETENANDGGNQLS